MMNKGNEVLYLGTIYAGGGWADIAKGNTSVRGVASVTVLWPFIENLDLQLSKFLAEEAELLKLQAAEKKLQEEAAQNLIKDRSDAVLNNTFYKDVTACHAIGINAELQGLLDGKWVLVAETKGWDKATNCSATHPVQPWTFATLKEGLELRWRFWVVNQFEVYGPQFRAAPTTETKAAAERKAKEEADAKAAAEKIIQDARLEAARIIAAAKAAASKKITITCVKGKLTKKVTAVKPKCPAGYKKK